VKCHEWRAARLIDSEQENGAFLTHNDHTASYAIIRYNIRTYRSDGVIAVTGVLLCFAPPDLTTLAIVKSTPEVHRFSTARPRRTT